MLWFKMFSCSAVLILKKIYMFELALTDITTDLHVIADLVQRIQDSEQKLKQDVTNQSQNQDLTIDEPLDSFEMTDIHITKNYVVWRLGASDVVLNKPGFYDFFDVLVEYAAMKDINPTIIVIRHT